MEEQPRCDRDRQEFDGPPVVVVVPDRFRTIDSSAGAACRADARVRPHAISRIDRAGRRFLQVGGVACEPPNRSNDWRRFARDVHGPELGGHVHADRLFCSGASCASVSSAGLLSMGTASSCRDIGPLRRVRSPLRTGRWRRGGRLSRWVYERRGDRGAGHPPRPLRGSAARPFRHPRAPIPKRSPSSAASSGVSSGSTAASAARNAACRAWRAAASSAAGRAAA